MKRNLKRWTEDYGLFVLAVILLISIWEWVILKGWIPSFILPAPTAIWQS
jgi:putative hydroxymethylpyrimidine transport system permease protein